MRTQLRTPMAALAPRSKINVDITLNDDQQDAYVSSYTTLDSIEGEVSITAPCDTSFDDILITFEGMKVLYFSLVFDCCSISAYSTSSCRNTTLNAYRLYQNVC